MKDGNSVELIPEDHSNEDSKVPSPCNEMQKSLNFNEIVES